MGKAYSWTEITDLRQAAEGQIVTGVQSQLALPGGVVLGEGSSLTVTGADTGKTFDQMLDASQSTLGQVLGLTDRLAQSLFNLGPAVAEAVSVPTSAALATMGSEVSAAYKAEAAGASETNKLILVGLAVVGLLILLRS
jgi:hypothetical protein